MGREPLAIANSLLIFKDIHFVGKYYFLTRNIEFNSHSFLFRFWKLKEGENGTRREA